MKVDIKKANLAKELIFASAGGKNQWEDNMMQAFKMALGVDSAAWKQYGFGPTKEEVEAVMCKAKEQLDTLLVELALLYSEEFSTQEMKDMIELFQHPAMELLQTRMPLLMQKQYKIGEKWGEQLVELGSANS